jgi:hypothetical protein
VIDDDERNRDQHGPVNQLQKYLLIGICHWPMVHSASNARQSSSPCLMRRVCP